MPKFKVFLTSTFERKLAKTDTAFRSWFDNVLDQLHENPFVGKPLGANWFREKKYGKYRVYYLVYGSMQSVYVVNLSEKKDQQSIINSIKLMFDVYRGEMENLSDGGKT